MVRASLLFSPGHPAIDGFARDQVERRLLQAIDGHLNESELASKLRLEPATLRARLDRLLAVGVVELGPEPEVVDLAADRQREIVEILATMDSATHYSVLRVGRDADRKQIKSAYYALAPQFHPDRYFRKQLGSFRARIEAIFSRITIAHDVLSNDRTREEYDRYLGQSDRNRDIESLLGGASAPAAAPPSEPPRPEPSVSLPPPSLAERRQAFARRLTGTPPPPTASTSSVPPPVRNHDALRIQYEAAKRAAAKARLENLVATARSALAREDYIGAVNAYRLAVSLAPDDAAIQRACAETTGLAAKALAAGFLRQAAYEAEHERWAEAALSYARACEGLPNDAQAHERVAYATLKAGGNMRRAVEFARRAVQIAPANPAARATLALVYAAAGLEESARGEASRALSMDRHTSQLRKALKGLL